MLRVLMILPFICWSGLSSAAEEPTRFTLSTNENDAENVVPTRLEQGKELLGRVADAVRIGKGRLINSIILARNIVADQVEQLISENTDAPISIVTQPDEPNHSRRSLASIQSTTPINQSPSMEKQDSIRLENDTEQGLLERRKPDNIRQILNSFLRPTPIVDGIKEEEKYGNTGERFNRVGRVMIDAYESFSNFLNAIVEVPANAVRKTSQGITDVLNNLGARLVGLQ